MPSKVTFGNGNTITYLYAADGTKLCTVHKAGSTITTTDYCGNVVYENGTQKLLLTEEGYVTLADSKYHYYLKDHQGNNRVVISQSGTVEETNHYYPFGGVFAATNNVQPYKYNGKEFDNKNGLNWYDYGARHYDAALGRFVSVDPLAEQDYAVSPYTYCGNNPVLRIDKDGRIWDTVWDAFNVAIGVKSFKENMQAGNYGAAVVDGVGVLADAVAAAVPFVPGGIGATVKGLRTIDNTEDVVQAMKRGVLNEKKVLKDMGLEKNAKTHTTILKETNEVVTTIPDAITDTKIIEIKDTKSVYNTKQIKAERQVAKESGRQFEIVTGEKTHVSKKISEDEIVRRKDIGPK